jgi:DNA-binding MarR family transcriptional regulator
MSNAIAARGQESKFSALMGMNQSVTSQNIEESKVGYKALKTTAFSLYGLPLVALVGGCIAFLATGQESVVAFSITMAGAAGAPIGTFAHMFLSDAADGMPWKSSKRRALQWLSEQGYKLTKDEAGTLMTMGKVIIANASTGEKFTIKKESLEGMSMHLSIKKSAKSKPKVAISKQKRAILESLTPSGQELVDNIQKQGEQLLALPLTPEDQHAVERVLSDVDELNSLRSLVQGSEPTKLQLRTLKTLKKEMEILASNVNNSMMKQLEVHASYVEERNRQHSTTL